MTGMISAILLAAGRSERMGDLKPLQYIGSKTMLEIAMGNLLDGRLDELILVTGYRSDEIRASLNIVDERVKIKVNGDYEKGMGSSISSGIKELGAESQAVLIALVDMPLVKAATVNALVEAYKNKGSPIIIPVFQKKRGHPVLFSRKYYSQLEALSDDRGGHGIIASNPHDVIEVETSDGAIIEDIDTPLQLMAIKKRLYSGDRYYA